MNFNDFSHICYHLHVKYSQHCLMSISSLRFVLVSDLPLFLSFNFSLIDTEKKHGEKIQIFFYTIN